MIGHFQGAQPGANARALIIQLKQALEVYTKKFLEEK